MKKLMKPALALMMVMAFTVPAAADVFVFADIVKEKEIFILEEIEILKAVDVLVAVDLETDTAAEAKALVNQLNEANEFLSGDTVDLLTTEFIGSIRDSVNDNTGITQVNQAAGDLNNQGNVVAVAAVDGEFAFADAQAAAQQTNVDLTLDDLLAVHKDRIEDSINGNSGIVGVNQAAGALNNQTNAVAVSAGLEGMNVAMAESDLGQFNTNNVAFEFAAVKNDVIVGSINGNTGVVGVNQSAGSLNNQANIVSIAAIKTN